MTDEADLNLEEYWRAIRPPRKGGRGLVARLEGEQFGRLVVVSRHGTDKHGGSMWLCKCTCGQVTVVPRRDLRQGRVKSCGCLRKEYLKASKPHLRRRSRAQTEYERYERVMRALDDEDYLEPVYEDEDDD